MVAIVFIAVIPVQNPTVTHPATEPEGQPESPPEPPHPVYSGLAPHFADPAWCAAMRLRPRR